MGGYSISVPRPDFRRAGIKMLTGIWGFSFDKEDMGLAGHWYDGRAFDKKINVPFPIESALSGVENETGSEVFWYSRKVECSVKPNRRLFLCFGAVDYLCDAYINSYHLGRHEGGFSYFEFDITDYCLDGSNCIVLRVEDRADPSYCRGKQYWEKEPSRCWYPCISGIWQPVWLEERGDVFFENIKITPDIDRSCALFEIRLSDLAGPGAMCDISIEKDGKRKAFASIGLDHIEERVTIPIHGDDFIDEIHHWTPDNPQVYVAHCCLKSCGHYDEVDVTFGMRKIEVAGDRILLNNRPFYQRLILDQGYFPDSMYTAASDDDFIRDIKLIKSMGFNGVRLHQKIEDPRFYHYCDLLGLVVWLEMPSMYSFSDNSCRSFIRQWQDIVLTNYNHPSIIAYVPLNESWGVKEIYTDKRQQEFSRALYHVTKSMDPYRLVSSNDGWEQTESDICAVHDYCGSGFELAKKLSNIDMLVGTAAANRMIYASSFSYEGQPVVISEFGGIAFKKDANGHCWGYGEREEDSESFLKRLEALVKAIVSSGKTAGFCYTQFTDVFQEVNGLLSIDRKEKVEIRKLHDIFSQT